MYTVHACMLLHSVHSTLVVVVDGDVVTVVLYFTDTHLIVCHRTYRTVCNNVYAVFDGILDASFSSKNHPASNV